MSDEGSGWIRVERGIRKRKDGSGKWTYYIYGKHKGKHWHEKVGPDHKQAQAARRKKLMELEERDRFPERFVQDPIEEITLKDLGEHYVENYKATCSANSARSEGVRVRQLVNKLGPERLASGVTTASINRLFDAMLGEESWGKHQLSRSTTVNRYRNRLNSMFRFAVERGHVRRNPVQGVKRLKEPPARVHYLLPDELEKLVEAARPQLRPMIVVAANTGCRRSELVALRWDEVHLDTPEDDPLGPHLEISGERTKTGKPRVIPLNEKAVEALEGLPRDRYRVFGFTRFPQHWWNDARDKSGLFDGAVEERLQGFNWHSLRHHAASWMAKRTRDIYKVGAVLGHKNVSTTQRYAHLADEDLRATVDSLNGVGRRLESPKVVKGTFRKPA